jgi:hypothetical protein
MRDHFAPRLLITSKARPEKSTADSKQQRLHRISFRDRDEIIDESPKALRLQLRGGLLDSARHIVGHATGETIIRRKRTKLIGG